MADTAVYFVVGTPNVELATQADLLARHLNGTWGGPGRWGHPSWGHFVWALGNLIDPNHPVVLYLPKLAPDDVPEADKALERGGRELRRVFWLQTAEPDYRSMEDQWAAQYLARLRRRYCTQTEPAIALWRERGLVSEIDASGRRMEIAHRVREALWAVDDAP